MSAAPPSALLPPRAARQPSSPLDSVGSLDGSAASPPHFAPLDTPVRQTAAGRSRASSLGRSPCPSRLLAASSCVARHRPISFLLASASRSLSWREVGSLGVDEGREELRRPGGLGEDVSGSRCEELISAEEAQARFPLMSGIGAVWLPNERLAQPSRLAHTGRGGALPRRHDPSHTRVVAIESGRSSCPRRRGRGRRWRTQRDQGGCHRQRGRRACTRRMAPVPDHCDDHQYLFTKNTMEAVRASRRYRDPDRLSISARRAVRGQLRARCKLVARRDPAGLQPPAPRADSAAVRVDHAGRDLTRPRDRGWCDQ